MMTFNDATGLSGTKSSFLLQFQEYRHTLHRRRQTQVPLSFIYAPKSESPQAIKPPIGVNKCLVSFSSKMSAESVLVPDLELLLPLVTN